MPNSYSLHYQIPLINYIFFGPIHKFSSPTLGISPFHVHSYQKISLKWTSCLHIVSNLGRFPQTTNSQPFVRIAPRLNPTPHSENENPRAKLWKVGWVHGLVLEPRLNPAIFTRAFHPTLSLTPFAFFIRVSCTHAHWHPNAKMGFVRAENRYQILEWGELSFKVRSWPFMMIRCGELWGYKSPVTVSLRWRIFGGNFWGVFFIFSFFWRVLGWE